ncbi:MAG: hypothetical protein QW100_03765 [Thermoplasmatales archaeon]
MSRYFRTVRNLCILSETVPLCLEENVPSKHYGIEAMLSTSRKPMREKEWHL